MGKSGKLLRFIFVVSFAVVFFSSQAFAVVGQHEQTPWQTTVGNGVLQTNKNWPGYNTGYEFTVLKNGVISALGGFFNGTKTVRLYDSAGNQLAVANVTDSNSWGYALITPVIVTAGQRYTVAVQTGWSGASMYIGTSNDQPWPNFPNFPYVIGDIQIERSVFGMGSGRPAWEIWGQMWGQADVVFVLDGIVIQ